MTDDTAPIAEWAVEALGKVVDGVCAFHLQFDGPSTAVIGSQPYDCLTSTGLRNEGDIRGRLSDPEAAVRAYGWELAEYLKDHSGMQIAWRARPHLEVGVEGCSVYSRLAVL